MYTYYVVIMTRLSGNGPILMLQALALITQKFDEVNQREGDVAETLYVMLLHGRVLLVTVC